MSKTTGYTIQDGYTTMPLRLSGNYPAKILFDGRFYDFKTEAHVSLLVYKHFPESLQHTVKSLFQDYITSHEIRLVSLDDEFRQVKKDSRASIIQMCTVSGLKGFIDLLRQKLNLDLELLPTHVTLYVAGSPLGIGINSVEDLEKYTNTIEKPF